MASNPFYLGAENLDGVSASYITGILPLAHGGTGADLSAVTPGTVVYHNGSAFVVTAVGSAGQVLTSNGTGAPTWSGLTTGVSSVANTDGNLVISPTSGAVIANMASTIQPANVSASGQIICSGGGYPFYAANGISGFLGIEFTGNGSLAYPSLYFYNAGRSGLWWQSGSLGLTYQGNDSLRVTAAGISLPLSPSKPWFYTDINGALTSGDTTDSIFLLSQNTTGGSMMSQTGTVSNTANATVTIDSRTGIISNLRVAGMTRASGATRNTQVQCRGYNLTYDTEDYIQHRLQTGNGVTVGLSTGHYVDKLVQSNNAGFYGTLTKAYSYYGVAPCVPADANPATNYAAAYFDSLVVGNDASGAVAVGDAKFSGTVTATTAINAPKISNLTSNGFVKTSGGTGTLSTSAVCESVAAGNGITVAGTGSGPYTGAVTVTLSGITGGQLLSATSGTTTSWTSGSPSAGNLLQYTSTSAVPQWASNISPGGTVTATGSTTASFNLTPNATLPAYTAKTPSSSTITISRTDITGNSPYFLSGPYVLYSAEVTTSACSRFTIGSTVGGSEIPNVFRHLKIVLLGSTTSGDDEVRVTWNNITTGTYNVQYQYFTSATTYTQSTSQTYVQGGYNAQDYWSYTELTFPDYCSSGSRTRGVYISDGMARATATKQLCANAYGTNSDTGIITRIDLFLGGTTWKVGTRLIVYGYY